MQRCEMKELSEQLLSTIESAEPRLRAISALESAKPVLSGGWSPKQVLGHLIDSASNNHQRFVRAAQQTSLEFPGYDQEGNVRVQAPQEADWSLLVSLWATYNRYLSHILARLPASKLETICRIGSNEPKTLGFIAGDYLTHLVHHLKQIGAAD
jgi:DinB family protein